MSERQEAIDTYVHQDRFKLRMWSEKDQYSNHFGHGWDAREAEVERLTAQLQAAQATIAEAKAIAVDLRRSHGRGVELWDILSRADLSTLAEHDKRVAAKAWERGHEQGYDSGRYAESDDEPETVETRSLGKNPYRASAERAEAE